MRVDFNADLGEGAGHDEELLSLVSSASIATGFHAGDARSITESIAAAKEAGVSVGSHPSFADRENFGRRELQLPAAEVFALVVYQVGAFQALAAANKVRPCHVKPHGALYNLAARDRVTAEAVARAVAAVDSSLILFAPERSELARAGEANGLRVAAEVFADRNYLADGSLVPRSRADALLHDPKEAAARVVRMLREGVVRAVDGTEVSVKAETICVHGDTPDAVAFARALKTDLNSAGIEVTPLSQDE